MVIFFPIGLVFTWANTTEIWGSFKKTHFSSLSQHLSWTDNNSRRKTWGITVFSVTSHHSSKASITKTQAMPWQPMEFWLFVGGPRNIDGSFSPSLDAKKRTVSRKPVIQNLLNNIYTNTFCENLLIILETILIY